MKIFLYVLCFAGVIIGSVFVSTSGQTVGGEVQGWILLLASIIGILSCIGKRFDEISYDKMLGRLFVSASLLWGLLAAILQVVIFVPLLFEGFSGGGSFLSYGRLYPIFIVSMLYGFGGNILLLSGFHILRKTCEVSLSPFGLGYFIFWGYQLFLLLSVSGCIFGVVQGRLYAEAEWYADILLLLVLLSFLFIYVATLKERRNLRIYIGNLFYLGFILGFILLHVVNNLSVPLSFLSIRSHSIFSGLGDALVQFWYVYNMSIIFLNFGFLGMLYYFFPRLVGRPLYSYQLGVFHFWSLVIFSMWGGWHLLFFVSLGSWLEYLGVIIIIILFVPSVGGGFNFLLTLSRRWHLFWEDPIICMMVFSVFFYILFILFSLFDGLLFSLNFWGSAFGGIAGTYFGHLGWGGLLGFACLYYLVPHLWDRRFIYSRILIYCHLFLLLFCMILHGFVLLLSEFVRSEMFSSYQALGILRYSLDEIVLESLPFYGIYLLIGVLYLLGFLLMIYNIYRTVISVRYKVWE